MARPIHHLPFVDWWRGPDEGKPYRSVVILLFGGRVCAVGLWLLWAKWPDWQWRNLKPSPLFRTLALGPLLIKVTRHQALDSHTAVFLQP